MVDTRNKLKSHQVKFNVDFSGERENLLSFMHFQIFQTINSTVYQIFLLLVIDWQFPAAFFTGLIIFYNAERLSRYTTLNT